MTPFSPAAETHMTALHAYGKHAVASAEKLFALNLSAGRAALHTSSEALTQLLAVRDPRDLLALTTHSQAHFDRLLAYGREWIGIATGTLPAKEAPAALSSVTAVVAAAPAPVVVSAPAPKAAPTATSRPRAPAKPPAVSKPAIVAKPAAKAAKSFPAVSAAAQVANPPAESKQLHMLAPAKPATKKAKA